MIDDFNIEDEYGGFLDLLERHISEIDDEPIEHFGVKGMKWGVRKERPTHERLKSLGPDKVTRKTAKGETITLQKVPTNRLQEFLGRHSKNWREDYAKQATLNILDGSGKKIGDAMVQKKNNEELYLEWLGIKKSARGNGYATAVMKAAKDFGQQEGFKRMVLEVPESSKDAQHIYTKLGFKVVRGDFDSWGANMVYEFGEATHAVMTYFEKPSLDELVHFGVKGMKWGVRKKQEPVSLAEGYNKQHYNIDRSTYGRRGADRINERVKSGNSLKVARQAETDLHHKRIRNARLAVVGAYLLLQFAPLLQVSANNMAANYVNKKHMQKGAKAAANLFSDKRGIPNYSTISATFNNTSGMWE